MSNNMISLKDAMSELGISAQGLDNHIKNKNMQKHYDGRRALITIEDYNIIKKAIELNGRVKKIKQQDNKDLELLKKKEELEKEKVLLESRLKEYELKLNSSLDTIEHLKEDKENYKDLLDKANLHSSTLQKLLDQEQQLRAKDMAVIDSLKGQVLMLNESKDKADKLIKEKEEIETKFNSTLEEKNIATDTVKKLEEELIEIRSSNEILIGELNSYKNRSFTQKLKALFSK